MEVILKQDVEHLGNKHDVVKVRPGYARNFLFPKGYAVEATQARKKEVAEVVKQCLHKEEKLRKEAEKMADMLGSMVLKVEVKTGEKGKIFGSVSSLQVAEALQKAGCEIVKKNIIIENTDNIKSLGKYSASIKIYKDIFAKINFEVVAESTRK